MARAHVTPGRPPRADDRHGGVVAPVAQADAVTRYPGDGVRLGLAVVLLAVAAWSARGAARTVLEVNLFRVINGLPAAVAPPLIGVMQLGALAAVPVFAAAAAIGRRRQLARLLLLAGAVAWVIAKLLTHFVDEEPPTFELGKVVLHGAVAPGLAFPATHAAVAAAMATVAGPYLARPNRRLAWWLVTAVGVARVYVGAHFPMDVVGGIAVGWAVGSIFHLVLGAPRGLPRAASVAAALDGAGLAVVDIRSLPSPSAGVAAFGADTADGRSLAVKAVSRDRPEADWLYRAWRLVAYRESEDEHAISSPAHLVDHEAHVLLVAERAGLRTPRLVTTTNRGPGWSVLATTRVDGEVLRDAEHAITDAVLVDAWREVARMHELGIAHGALRSDCLVIGEDRRVWLADLGSARIGSGAADQLVDVAELCASLAEVVAPRRVADAAALVLGPDRLAAALPYVQPLTLTSTTRRQLAARRGLLDDVRAAIAASAGVEAPHVVKPVGVAARNLLPLAGALFAINFLLPQFAHVDATVAALRHAAWPWLLLVAALYASTNLMAAVALLGAVRGRLALGRTMAVQLAAVFTNRMAPAGLGAVATKARYLEAAGTTRPAAVAALTLDSFAGFVVHAIGVVAVVPLLGAGGGLHLHLSAAELPEHWVLLVAVVAILFAAGVVVRLLKLHRRLLAPARAGWTALAGSLSDPRSAAALFLGSAGVTAGYALAFAASAHAFGVGLGTSAVVAVYLAGSAVAAVTPTPGGLGATEAALVAGLTAAGAAAGPAVAAVLAYRLVTFWLPLVPAFVAYRSLRRTGVL